MKPSLPIVLVLAAGLVILAGQSGSIHPASKGAVAWAQTPGTPPPGGPPRTGAPPVWTGIAPDTAAAERDSTMKAVLAHIAGREQSPAESVFKNIKLFKGMPAERMLRIMNMGWGRSLGVPCSHCHEVRHWDDDGKPQKQIARNMSEMTRTINQELLAKIEHLQGKPPTVNCTTCHRGSAIPALRIP